MCSECVATGFSTSQKIHMHSGRSVRGNFLATSARRSPCIVKMTNHERGYFCHDGGGKVIEVNEAYATFPAMDSNLHRRSCFRCCHCHLRCLLFPNSEMSLIRLWSSSSSSSKTNRDPSGLNHLAHGVTTSTLALSKSTPKPCYKQYTGIFKIDT
jgi:hypothetical protein